MEYISKRGEDFLSFVNLRRLEGRKASQRQLFIDYLRLVLGDSRVQTYDLKKNFLQTFPLFENSIVDHSFDDKIINRDIFNKALESLSRLERSVISLFYIWGLSLTEIGECFGFDCSYASLIHSKALRKIRKKCAAKLQQPASGA